MKLWYIEVFPDDKPDGQSWAMPGTSARVAVNKILRSNYKDVKAAQVYFKPATKDQLERYIKKHGKL